MSKPTIVVIGKVVDSFKYTSKRDNLEYFGAKVLPVCETSHIVVYEAPRQYAKNEVISIAAKLSLRSEKISTTFVAELNLDVAAISKVIECGEAVAAVPAAKAPAKP